MSDSRLDREASAQMMMDIENGTFEECTECREYNIYPDWFMTCGICGAEACVNCGTRDITPGVERWLCMADSLIDIDEINEMLQAERASCDQRYGAFL